MAKFNINDPLDFAKIVGSGAGKALLPFTGSGTSAWEMLEGGFYHDTNNIAYFHVFGGNSDVNFQSALRQINDNGGRRKAKFEFPYLDGQMTEDLGRKPETFDLDILIHGNNYLAAYKALMKELNEPSPGTLIHPIRGNIECACESYQVLHESSSRKAVAIRLTMIENSFDGMAIRKQKNPSASSAISKLVSAFVKITNAIGKIEAAVSVARTIKNAITQTLTEYQNRFSKTSGNMNATFNPGSDIPALRPVTQGGLQNEDGSLATNFVSIVSSPNDPYTNLPPELTDSTLQTALATEQLFKDITSLRNELEANIVTIEALNDGEGALEFFETVNELRTTAVDMQDAYDKGKQSSRVQIVEYVTPREMSVREIAYENSIDLDSIIEILLLNSGFESANSFPKDTKLRLAVTR